MFTVFWTFWLAACAILWLAAAVDFWSALLCFCLTVPQTILLWRSCARIQIAPSMRRPTEK